MNLLNAEEIKYISEEIKKTISSIESGHFQWIMRNEYGSEHDLEEYKGWTEIWIRTRIRDLYYLLLAYFEARSMTCYLATFKEKFSIIIQNDDEIFKSELTHPEGEPELEVITGFRQFLDPFKFFDYRQTREDEKMKLISILNNTEFILKNCNTHIKNESDLYKQVKWVLALYYPTCRQLNKASFIQQFKVYNPDILIPELKTAIEFKYVKSDSDNIDDFIDQIRVDAANYTDDVRYENFIAVIYLQNTSIATPSNIQESWKAKNFPNNWELITVNGSPSLKKTTN